MKKLNFDIHIDAPREKVWDTMLGDATYRQWTKVFSEGSHYIGNWEEGSKIYFVGPDSETKVESGMVSVIRENRKPEYLSIEHIGMYANGVEDTESEEVKKWTPAFENYTFVEKDGGTDVLIEVDIDESYHEEFKGMWPKALAILKEISEK